MEVSATVTQERGELNGRTGTVEQGAAPALPAAVAEALGENGESLARALKLLSRMEREGTLEELASVLALLKLLKDALTDDMVIGLAQRVQHVAAVAADPGVAALADRLAPALRAAEAGAAAASEPPSLMDLWRKMRDPQVRRGLAYTLELVKHLAP